MDAEITIVGAGVIGLAIAEELSSHCDNLYLLERHSSFGQETSSRNSEVVHAGIYYPEKSLKARFSVEGNKLLYDYCSKYDIPFRRTGKLIIATDKMEEAALEPLRIKALANGVILETIGKEKISSLQPGINAIKALYSSSTGIIDSHSLMKQFETNTLHNGGQIVYSSEVCGIRKIDNGYEVTIKNPDGSTFSFSSRILINSAGLAADKIAAMAGVHDDDLRIIFCKGEYFRMNRRSGKNLKMLVYPVPHPQMEGIGVHVTIDIAGDVRLGPDVQYLNSNIYDYTSSDEKIEQFYRSAVKFLPFLSIQDLSPDMSGIRPKIQKPGEPQKDFYVMEESGRGLPGLINLIGMESPGLTSCISIAKYIRRMIFS